VSAIRGVFYFSLEALGIFKNNFVLGWLRKHFDKALVSAWASVALAMCLQN